MTDRPQKNVTRVDQPPDRRKTEIQFEREKPEPLSGRPKAIDNRKIVGVLASYSWQPEGKLYEVRQGRTHIGAGQIKDDPEHRQVEVHCPLDDLLSGDHALILVQQEDYYIQDLASVNGTKVNGKKLRPEAMEDLPNNAHIITGRTEFTFLKIEAKSGPVEMPAAEVTETTPPRREKTILK